MIQGALYNIEAHTWPTNVDLMDFMLLVSQQTGAGQAILKIFLVAVAVLYLLAFFYLYMLGRPSSHLAGAER